MVWFVVLRVVCCVCLGWWGSGLGVWSGCGGGLWFAWGCGVCCLFWCLVVVVNSVGIIVLCILPALNAVFCVV